MRKNRIFALLAIVVAVAFGGFCVENIFISFTLGFVDNRNMHLPFLLGYGLGILALYVCFGTPGHMRLLGWRVTIGSRWLRTGLYFALVVVCVTLAEIAIGTAVEKISNITWWEYTTLPLNITKFASVPTSLAFGALVTVFMERCFPVIYDRLSRVKSPWFGGILSLVMAVLMMDMVLSYLEMHRTEDFLELWKLTVRG